MKETADFAKSLLDGFRHLVVTAVMPGLILVGGGFFITSSGVNSPRWTKVVKAANGLDGKQVGLLLLAAWFVGAALRPIQFGFTQLLEGYWGSSAGAVLLATYVRKLRYARIDRLLGMAHPKATPGVSPRSLGYAIQIRKEEAERQLGAYPMDPYHVMPTKLGNALRRGEVGAGAPYGLNAIPVISHLHSVGDPETVRYVEGTRTQLDIAITQTLVFLLVAVSSLVVYLGDGSWLSVPLLCAVASWMSYRGAISAAREYASSLMVLVDLNRFRLYETLNLPKPKSLEEERKLAEKIDQLIRLRSDVEGGLQYSS